MRRELAGLAAFILLALYGAGSLAVDLVALAVEVAR